ncbi:uncharacterized protein LOC111019278 isoform X1 [Momordica charantia]|uniref:Uncharacterized protein LOC111019278 isoform X1 n=1 Tax=Momordica charantia TaxID=3673 RepID=A0A6J1DE92_MOMCH|nr:uncharacterized protein LOC111019278 isoform X1 [Momordica charantia]
MIATGTACKRILELKCIFVILESRTWIRIGGSLYNVGNLEISLYPFQKMSSGLFGFTKGCINMNREIIYMDSHLLRLFPIYWEGKMKIYDHNASDTLQGQNFSSFTMLQPHSMPRLSKRK